MRSEWMEATAKDQDIADFEHDRRRQPRGTTSSLKLIGHGLEGGDHHADQLTLSIGKQINVIETQTAHNSDYYIIGETHKLSMGATLYETVWYLEPVPSVYPHSLENSCD